MHDDVQHRLERKLDLLCEKLDKYTTNLAVHSAVCDADRADLRKESDRTSQRLWKLLLVALGAGGSGAALVESAKALLGS